MSNDKDASNSASSSAHKRKYPGDDNESEPMGADSMESSETPSVSYSFKKPHVRVARRVSVSEDGDKNEASSGNSKHPSRYQDRSRDEAQPLGRNKKWVPPNSIRNIRREGREIPSLPGQHKHPAPSYSNASPMVQSNPNDETIPLPVPGKCVELIKIFVFYYLFKFFMQMMKYSVHVRFLTMVCVVF